MCHTVLMDTKAAERQADKEALVREMLGRVADKWTLVVIDELDDGPLRFTQLRERIGGVTQKMLTKTLRQLERDGLVTREVHAVVPPRVDYELTRLGRSLGGAVCAMWEWAERHHAQVARARSAYEQRSARATRPR